MLSYETFLLKLMGVISHLTARSASLSLLPNKQEWKCVMYVLQHQALFALPLGIDIATAQVNLNKTLEARPGNLGS